MDKKCRTADFVQAVEDMKQRNLFLKIVESYWPVILLLILVIPSIWPLLRSGMFLSDDGEWMVIRFSAFHQALRDGQFPVRWLGRLNNGYGYPVANFLYPGFMYLAEIPKILGLGFVDSIKIILGLSLVGSAIFTFLWLRTTFANLSALLGALIYLYAPYHLWDLYKRGSVGEVLALAIVPFILWMIEKKNLFLISLGIGLLILSHNTLAILFLPVIVVYGLFRKILNTKYLILNTVLGLGLSAFFWIPAIFDLQYTKFFQTQVSNWQEHFADFGLLGWPTIIILVLSVAYCYDDLNHHNKPIELFLVVGLGTLFLSLPQSFFFWQKLPVSFIQFPFRLLSLTILSGAFLTAYIINRLANKKRILVTLLLLFLTLISARSHLQPKAFFDKGEGFYATNEATTTVANEYMPMWVKKIPLERPKEKIEVTDGQVKIEMIKNNNREIVFNTSANSTSQIKINTLYFPGWVAKIDGLNTPISFENTEGLIILSVPEGKHKIDVLWKETTLRKFSDIISLVSLMVLIIWQIKKLKYV